MTANRSMEELANAELTDFAQLLNILGLTHSDLSPVFGANGVYLFCSGRTEGKVCPSKVSALVLRLAGVDSQEYQPTIHRCGVLILTAASDQFVTLKALLGTEAI